MQTASIHNISTYNTRMERSMIDKLFFVDKIDADRVIDYGCADGTLLHYLETWMPNLTHMVGYDINTDMLKLAKQALSCPVVMGGWADYVHKGFKFKKKNKKHAFLTTDWSAAHASTDGKEWDEVEFKHRDTTTALVLSSVVHEVLHYSSPEVVADFWKRVFNSGFRYICIRDMIPARSIDRPSETNDVAKVYNKFGNQKVLQDFERQWGSIESNKNLVHFLLKYKYLQPNWEREVRENYLPMYREDLLAMIPRQYQVVYHAHFVLPWIARQVRNDMGLRMHDNTHIKIIMELM